MDYFKPLRRKIGVVTLLIACVFAAWWVRSLTKFDFINITCKGTCYRYASRVGVISLVLDAPLTMKWWSTGDTSAMKAWYDPDGRLRLWDHFHVEWRRTFGEFDIGSGIRKTAPQERVVSCTFPYWSIVIPLTFLSAWLLLSKPRSAKKFETLPATSYD